MAVRGITTIGCDPKDLAVIDGRWIQAILDLGVRNVRVKWICAPDGSFPHRLYAELLDVLYTNGLNPLLDVDQDFLVEHPSSGVFPNMPLNRSKDRLSSPWIDPWTQRLAATLAPFARLYTLRVSVWNEPNVRGAIAPGLVLPAGNQSWALSPEIFGALLWQAFIRCHAVGVQEIYVGALSVLPKLTGLGTLDNYYANYMRRSFQVVRKYIAGAKFDYAGICVNCEGIWDEDKFSLACALMRDQMYSYMPGDQKRGVPPGLLIASECGIENRDNRRAQLPATLKTIDRYVDEWYYFQHHGSDPAQGDPKFYQPWGLQGWQRTGRSYTPGPQFPLYPVVTPCLQGRFS